MKRIDMLVHNAGLVANRYSVTEDGHEFTLRVNYLVPFLVHERLGESGADVVVTSSAAHPTGRVRLNDLDREKRRYLRSIVAERFPLFSPVP